MHELAVFDIDRVINGGPVTRDATGFSRCLLLGVAGYPGCDRCHPARDDCAVARWTPTDHQRHTVHDERYSDPEERHVGKRMPVGEQRRPRTHLADSRTALDLIGYGPAWPLPAILPQVVKVQFNPRGFTVQTNALPLGKEVPFA
jgi:hypothetical protein